jgi:serine/threonine-protein kinase
MAKKEKFGKFVLLEVTDQGAVGTEYRAAKLGTTGLEKIVSLLRLAPALSGSAEVARSLMDQAKVAAQLQNPNIVKLLGIGKVEASYYISHEFIEGKSLRAILARCRLDGFPFSVDHALLIASKLCSALEYAHGRKSEAGGRYFHGALNPGNVVVSYEGEVRVRGFGYWPGRIREGGLGPEDHLYLAPEQAAGEVGSTRSDAFAVGALLFETLTGRALFEGGRSADVMERIALGRLWSPPGDDDTLPKAIVEILNRCLAVDPAGRYPEIQELRKAVDTLLFSGDFTPTTFNLAFFMHSLFREDIELESKALKAEKESSYLEYFTEEAKAAPRPAAAAAPATLAMPSPVKGARLEAQAAPHLEARSASTQASPPAAPAARGASASGPVAQVAHRTQAGHSHAASEGFHESLHSGHPPAPHESSGLTAKQAAAGFTFHKEERQARSRRVPILAALGLLVLVAAGAGTYFVLQQGALCPTAPPPATLPPPTLSAEAQAALERIKGLEDKLRKLEEDKAAAAARAEEQATKRLEEQAKARGEQVDPEALAKAQEEARKKAQLEQERKAQEERRRLEEEKRAEEARIADEQRRAEEARRVAEAAAAAAVTTTLPAPPPAAVPSVKVGQLVDLEEPGVIAPLVERKPQPQYPPIALRQRVDGIVEVNALVDETGDVAETRLKTPAGGRTGLNEAAMDAVKRYKFRPATKDGVPVKVWVSVKVAFVLPR